MQEESDAYRFINIFNIEDLPYLMAILDNHNNYLKKLRTAQALKNPDGILDLEKQLIKCRHDITVLTLIIRNLEAVIDKTKKVKER